MWEKSNLRFISSKVFFYWLYIPAIFLILIVAIASYYLNIPISRFTRDPLAITDGHPFLGVVSNIGAILWSATVAICFFSYAILITYKKSHDVLSFIMFGGFISLLLLLDDLFMLHERIYPKYLGGSEKIVFLFYVSLLLLYLVKYRLIIIETDLIYLILAAFFFALSMLIDLLPESFLPWHHLFEDGPKFIGIVSWFGYHFTICFKEVQSIAYTAAPDKSINLDG